MISSAIFIHIVQIMFPIVAIVLLGILIGRRQNPQLDSINNINLNVFIPALVFASLIEHDFALQSNALLAFVALLLMLATGLLALPLSRLLHTEYRTVAPPLMFHNAGNVGLPLMLLALGDAALAPALVLFLVGNLAHFAIATYILNRASKWYRSLSSPAILAAVLALGLQLTTVEIAPTIILPIRMLGDIAVPLMLFGLGVQLSHAEFNHWRLGLAHGLITPVIGFSLAFLLSQLFDLEPIQTAALLLFGTLPPAVMNFLLAKRYAQEPSKVSAIVLIGNVLAVFSLPLALLYVLPRFI